MSVDGTTADQRLQPMNEPEDRLAKFEVDIEKLGYSFDAQLAITTGAALDWRLEQILITEMQPINRELKDRLFTGYGALSGFAAKIDLAYALHIISKSVYHTLRTIKKIRDLFAHRMEFTSFETPEIVALLNTLDLDMGINSMKVRYMMKIADLNGELVHGYHLRTGVSGLDRRALLPGLGSA
jgi:hypothetical protein